MTARKDPAQATPAIQSSALTWWRYVVAEEQAATALLSASAIGIDKQLSDDAWVAADGQSRVPASRFKQRCEVAGFNPGKIWQELVAAGLWRLSDDKQWIYGIRVAARRARSAQSVEQRQEAGRKSGEKRRSRAQKTRQQPPDHPNEPERSLGFVREDEEAMSGDNPFPPNDIEHTSTTVRPEQKREEGTTPDPSPKDRGVVPPADAAGASAGAPAPSAVERAQANIAHVQPPDVWLGADARADVAQLLQASQDLGIDVERALYRICATHQALRGPEGHQPLLDELRACLTGDTGRHALLQTSEPGRALALALFASALLPPRLEPLQLRTLTGRIAIALKQRDDAHPLTLACEAADELRRGGITAAYELPDLGRGRASGGAS